ncbi:hypothetical protein BHE74_00013242 [Ensete ventricosum]|nr:hypothetical protein GW17_00029712 [Ensete ventricosum]RWW78539.1 hypothetical protein BHE74_00013242 [Ensete ventricosum]RZR93101.1 hypothetical protein BHM03_00021516 [Ensete ventricosum]
MTVVKGGQMNGSRAVRAYYDVRDIAMLAERAEEKGGDASGDDDKYYLEKEERDGENQWVLSLPYAEAAGHRPGVAHKRGMRGIGSRESEVLYRRAGLHLLLGLRTVASRMRSVTMKPRVLNRFLLALEQTGQRCSILEGHRRSRAGRRATRQQRSQGRSHPNRCARCKKKIIEVGKIATEEEIGVDASARRRKRAEGGVASLTAGGRGWLRKADVSTSRLDLLKVGSGMVKRT